MKRKLLLISFFSCSLILFVSCINEGVERKTSTLEVIVGDSLPAFRVTMNDGKELDNTMFRGKTGVIAFFHTECPDCQHELPILNALYLAHAGDSLFLMACIARAQGSEEILTYWDCHGLELPFSAQEDRTVFNLFAHSRIPHIYISDADGIVRFIHDDRDMPRLDTLEKECEALAEGV